MHDAGWAVDSRPTPDMAARKADLGVPMAAASCHTSVIQGYVVEGHVPLPAIELLLRERPGIAGIALPGMEAGSPGMDGQPSSPFGSFPA